VSPALEPRAIEVAARRASAPQSVVSSVVKSWEMQIRKIRAKGYDCLAEIQIEISQVAKDYGARNGLDPFVLDECCRFVLEQFPMLSVAEIRYAYRSWASGEIEVTNAEMYGGVMDVRQLGKVLSAWVDYRNKIYSEYCKETERIEKEAAEIERKKIADAEFEKNFPHWIAEFSDKCNTWKDVPFFLYDQINLRSPIKFEKGEANAILAEAKILAKKEIEAEKMDAQIRLKHISAVKLDAELEDRAKSIARKISVFRKVLKSNL
jgi:hypothetical protein